MHVWAVLVAQKRYMTYFVENEVELPYICKPCKAEIPKLRELMGLKQKYNQLNEQLTQLKSDLATQELKFANQEENVKTLSDRLAALEERSTQNIVEFPILLEANQPHHIQQFVNEHI